MLILTLGFAHFYKGTQKCMYNPDTVITAASEVCLDSSERQPKQMGVTGGLKIPHLNLRRQT